MLQTYPHKMASVDANTVFLVTTDNSGPVQFTVSYTIGSTRPFGSINCTYTATKGNLTRIVLPNGLHLTQVHFNVTLKAEKEKNIIVYGNHGDSASSGFYLGLPYFETATKTYDYYAVSLPSSTHENNAWIGYIGVVILKDTTVLSVTPTVMLTTVLQVTFKAKQKSILGKFDKGIIYILLTTTGDLTGSKISSNNPIAFFTGLLCVTQRMDIDCDHITQQLPSAETFGFTFFLVPLHLHQPTWYKLVASINGTGVTINCVSKQGEIVHRDYFKFNEGQFKQFEIDPDHYCSIEATFPLLVVQIVFGHLFNRTMVSNTFTTMVPPLSQYRNEYTFLFAEYFSVDNSSNPAVFERQLSVCVPVNCFNSSQILFDDQPLPDSVIYVPVKCKHEDVCAYCAQYEVPDAQARGVHTLKHSNPKCTLGVIVSGYGQEYAYGYPAGMNLDSIAGTY